jgi:hypothetical protein
VAKDQVGEVSRTDALKLIPQFELNNGRALFRRHHLNREIVIGLIGLRGEMKSLTGSIIALVDFMLEGMGCESNMSIACKFKIEDDMAQKYGLRRGGEVSFKSEELDRLALFRLDDRYHRKILFIDEINMQFAEARRAMAGTNLESAAVVQQLRKLQCSLIYTVIHEMWVDPRIRDGTDVFIKCEDTALTPEALAQKRPLGVTCQWTVYPMTRILTGWTYQQTHKTLGPFYVSAKPYWGIMDTYQLQHRGSYAVKMAGKQGVDIDFKPDPKTIEMRNKWGWLYDGIQALHDEGVERIEADQLWDYLQLDLRHLRPEQAGGQLRDMGLFPHRGTRGNFYLIDKFDLTNVKEVKEAVLTP